MKIFDRKYNLAVRVSKALNESGIKAKLVRNEVNSKGHRDYVLVKTDVDNIHIMGLKYGELNERIPFMSQPNKWLADKTLIAICWDETIYFVKPEIFYQLGSSIKRIDIKNNSVISI